MPNFVDYSTENMNGTPVHTFLDASGQPSPPMYGDQADQLAQSVDQWKQFQAANAGPDLSVAGPGGGDPNQSLPPDPGAAVSASPPQPGAAAPDYSPAAAAGQPAPPPGGPSPSGQQAATIHAAAASGNPIAGQQDPGAYINRSVVTPGVSREQLQRQAAGAVAIPKSGEETVEGAAPYDQDAADARSEANLSLRNAKQQQADMLSARAQRDADMFDQQAAIAAVKLQHEQAKQQAIQTGVEQDAQTAREFRDQVAKQQVDPNRLFSGDNGAFKTVAATVGLALGAFAGAGGGSPTIHGRRAAADGSNVAKDIIDGAVSRDINAQEANIRSGTVAANNQLNDVYQRIGDMNQAKTIVRQMQTDYAGMQMKALAARDGSQDAANAYAQWDAANQADRAEQERKFIADSYGKHTVKVAQAFASPQAGGVRAPTEGEIRSRIATQKDLGELGAQGASQQADINLKNSTAAKNNADAANAKTGGDGGYNAQVEPVDTAISAIDNLATKYGYTLDPKTGQYVEGSSSSAGFPRNLPLGVDTPTTSNFKKDLNEVNVLHSIATTGNKRANADSAADTGATAGLMNGPVAERLAQMRHELAIKKASIASGATGATRAARQGERVQVGRESQPTEADDIQEE